MFINLNQRRKKHYFHMYFVYKQNITWRPWTTGRTIPIHKYVKRPHVRVCVSYF